MNTRGKGSLVDPNRPTESNWLRSNGALVEFGNGRTPHSSASTTVSSVFDNRTTGSTISTVESLRNDDRDANETSANESRFSKHSMDDASSPTTSSRHKFKKPWDALLHKILRRKIQESNLEVKNGNGVQFTLISTIMVMYGGPALWFWFVTTLRYVTVHFISNF
jgi:hypothetical protein